MHVQNATLAGGVAVGSSADLLVQPWGALAVGAAAGALSVFGYAKLQVRKLKTFGPALIYICYDITSIIIWSSMNFCALS